MPGPAIHTERLSKRYGDTLALDALDLTVERGEVYGYLGPNGAGKTTTIRLLLGLHRPSAGRGELFGIDAWRDPVAAHRHARLRRRRAVSVAGADQRGDVRVPRAPARRHRRGLPRRARGALPAGHPQEDQGAVEGQPPEGAADRGARHARRSAAARRADERPRPADGDGLPRVRPRGEGARADDLPLLAHPRGGRGAVRSCRDPQAGADWWTRGRSRSCATSPRRPSR